jgi:Polymer-forming cytoskeletal
MPSRSGKNRGSARPGTRATPTHALASVSAVPQQGSGPRHVQCYHCHHDFDVPPMAMSLTCPWCYKRVTLDDLVVSATCWTSRVQTCGKLLIDRKGSLVASLIEARSGMVILGGAEGKLISGGPVYIGPEARVHGDLEAPGIDIAPGAVIQGGFFKIVTTRVVTPGTRQAGFIRPGPSGSSGGSDGGGGGTEPRTVDPNLRPASRPEPSIKVRFPTRLPSDNVPADKPAPPAKPAIKPAVRLPDWFKRHLRAT